jgi:hypothetical protein
MDGRSGEVAASPASAYTVRGHEEPARHHHRVILRGGGQRLGNVDPALHPRLPCESLRLAGAVHHSAAAQEYATCASGRRGRKIGGVSSCTPAGRGSFRFGVVERSVVERGAPSAGSARHADLGSQRLVEDLGSAVPARVDSGCRGRARSRTALAHAALEHLGRAVSLVGGPWRLIMLVISAPF